MVYFYKMIKFQRLALNLENECFYFTPVRIYFSLARTMHFCRFQVQKCKKNHFEIVYFTFKDVKRDLVNTKVK